jgi:hypothetical protein
LGIAVVVVDGFLVALFFFWWNLPTVEILLVALRTMREAKDSTYNLYNL